MKNIIVIGASAGGIAAIKKTIGGLSKNIDGAVIVVLHVSQQSNCSIIASILQKSTDLNCVTAEDGAMLQKGFLYLAPSGYQLMIKDNRIMLTQGPYENKYRPSIDVLFRSAALYFRNRVIGIILTGLLEDGTSGMTAIKKGGGICIVQDPLDASFSDMPESVLNKIKPDFILPVEEICDVINKLLLKMLPPELPVVRETELEVKIVENMITNNSNLKIIGEKSDFVCPDCGGELYTIKEESGRRYRCYTGHVYTERILDEVQDKKLLQSLWTSIRMFEEKANLMQLMSNRNDNDQLLTKSYNRRIAEINEHINTLKSFLLFFNDLHENFPKNKELGGKNNWKIDDGSID
jgi:two-component system chemotaxis response regulator CheB